VFLEALIAGTILIIGVPIFVLTLYGARLLRMFYAKQVVEVAVIAVEQLAKAGHIPKEGTEKKHMVKNFVARGASMPSLDDDLLDFIIEAAVAKKAG